MTSAGQGGATPALRHAARMSVKRRLILVGAAVVLVLVPAIVMVLVTWVGTGKVQGAATWASIPAIVGVAAALAAGRRYAIIVSIVMAFLAPVAIVAGMSPVSGAALMAILCMTVGRMSRVGLHRSGLLVPVMLAWALIDPPAWNGAATVDRLDNQYLLWMAAIFLVGGLLPALVVSFLTRKRKAPDLQAHSQREAVTYTVMITTLVTVGTYYVLDNPKMIGGAFLIAVILVMAPIGTAQTLKPTIFRVLGTILGSIFVIALVAKVDSLGVIYLIGLLFLVVSVFARLSGLAWIYYVFMVPATACLNSTTLTQVGELGKQRVVDNVVGGILVILATAVTVGYSQWASRRGEASDGDNEVDASLERVSGTASQVGS
ncbi:MAG: FUSC family protein [Candidatus Nanopelagicales bacterium]|nr:FUSC family protein [Candidatus Nanopelagicales bacterium]